MNKTITREEAKQMLKPVEIEGIDPQDIYIDYDAIVDEIYDSFEQNTLSVTKQTVANLSTRMKEGKEYEVIIRQVEIKKD